MRRVGDGLVRIEEGTFKDRLVSIAVAIPSGDLSELTVEHLVQVVRQNLEVALLEVSKGRGGGKAVDNRLLKFITLVKRPELFFGGINHERFCLGNHRLVSRGCLDADVEVEREADDGLGGDVELVRVE